MKTSVAILGTLLVVFFVTSAGMSQTSDAGGMRAGFWGTPGGNLGTTPGGTDPGTVLGYREGYSEILGAFVAEPGRAYGAISGETNQIMASEYVGAKGDIMGAIGVNPGGGSTSGTILSDNNP